MSRPRVGDAVRILAAHQHFPGITGTVVGFGVDAAIVEVDPGQRVGHPVLMIPPGLLEVTA